MKACIFIPVYNNSHAISHIIRDCLQFCALPVLILDDGSDIPVVESLNSAEVRDKRLFLYRHDTNQGKGAALQSGFRIARRLGFTHLLAIDGDGQHFAQDIPKLLELSERFPTHLIIGSRRMNAANSPVLSRFGRACSDKFIRYATGKHVSDSQSGMRCYPLSPIENLPFHCTRYDFEMEILLRFLLGQGECLPVSIEVFYPKASERISHFRIIVDNLRILKLCLRIYFGWNFGDSKKIEYQTTNAFNTGDT